MKPSVVVASAWLVFSLTPALPARADDNVTIPKSRLQELEEKERELNRLKGTPAATNDAASTTRPAQQSAGSGPAPATEPAVAHVSPPLASLPALKEGEQVEALDLANHYRADASAADARYRGHKFLLRGEIAAFEKPVLRRDYKVLLKTADPATRIICSFYPPEKYSAVFAIDHGSQLVGVAGETRVPLARVGQNVILRADCKGWRNSSVIISGGWLEDAPAAH